MPNLAFCICVFIFFFAHVCLSFASDINREQRLVDEALAMLFVGEPLQLKAGDEQFLALETIPANSETLGGIILIHGRGLSADSPIVIAPLRESLADNGWLTLSLQMPVLEKQAKYYDYIDIFPQAAHRITSGVQYLNDKGISPIILVAHSCGVHMSMDWIAKRGDNLIDAYIGIGMGATDYQQPMLSPFPFEKISVPILDIYGSADYPAVLRNAPERWQQIQKSKNKLSEQVVVDDADHNFKDKDLVLSTKISTWLESIK